MTSYTIAYKTQRMDKFSPTTFMSGPIDKVRREAVKEHKSWNKRFGNNQTKIIILKDGKMFGEVYNLYSKGYMWKPKSGGEYPIHENGSIGKNREKREPNVMLKYLGATNTWPYVR